MKLLIVDDEKLTREGIRDSLGLESLGISQVLLEDDGIHGLKTALEERPDIVLTDVRMPRMNGVQMAERILKELPGTSIIFMSAYSDKEYLKAAIKLKALGYVEKPLDMEELASAVKEAVDSSRNEKISQAAARLQEKEQLGHLSLLLSQPEEESLIKAGQLAADLGLSITHTTCFCCIIIDCVTPLSALPEEQQAASENDEPIVSDPAANQPQNGDTQNGSIYIEGFGWIPDEGGSSVQHNIDSDGDINKQVGIMG